MMKYGFAAGALVLLILAVDPRLDVDCAQLFYVSHGHFIGMTAPGRAAREAARLAPFLLFFSLLLLHIGQRIGLVGAGYAPNGRSLLFLALSLALGPGLFVNGMKETMHLPRPVQIRSFGGPFAFSAFYSAEGECKRNCSFPSGEAAAAFWTLAPARFAPLPLRPILSALALLFGLATGGLRMSFGAHFLSDILAAGMIMIAVIVGLERFFLPTVPTEPRA